jgi:hypothetical protein
MTWPTVIVGKGSRQKGIRSNSRTGTKRKICVGTEESAMKERIFFGGGDYLRSPSVCVGFFTYLRILLRCLVFTWLHTACFPFVFCSCAVFLCVFVVVVFSCLLVCLLAKQSP